MVPDRESHVDANLNYYDSPLNCADLDGGPRCRPTGATSSIQASISRYPAKINCASSCSGSALGAERSQAYNLRRTGLPSAVGGCRAISR